MPLPISLIMIAKNEAHDLPSCINSAKDIVSEIILVDSGSTDKTAETAKSLGAKIYPRNFDTYSNQKNHALSLAGNNWVLHLDPDEKISPELKEEISHLFAGGGPDYDGFFIPYKNYFLGKEMRYGGLGSEKHMRLFKRSKSAFSGGLLHEGVKVYGKTGILKNKIIHNSYPDMREYLEKFNRYTTLAAKKLHESGKRFSFLNILAVPFEFIKRYIIKLGFLDGFAGLVWSAVSALYVFIKYVKLWQIERRK